MRFYKRKRPLFKGFKSKELSGGEKMQQHIKPNQCFPVKERSFRLSSAVKNLLFPFKPGADLFVVQTFNRFAEDFRIERRWIDIRNEKARMVNRNIVRRIAEVKAFQNVLRVIRVTHNHTKLSNIASRQLVAFYRKLFCNLSRVHWRHTGKHQHAPGQRDQEREAFARMFSAEHNY